MATKKINKKESAKPKAIAKKVVRKKPIKKTVKAVKKSPVKKTTRKKSGKRTKKEMPIKIKATKKVIKEEKKETEENSYFAKWIAPEHIKTRQDMIIYYASAILSVFSIIWFFRQGSFIVVATFLVLLIVIVLHIYQDSRDIEIKINLDGIGFGGIFYLYKDIESFEVVEGEYFNVLKFKLKSSFLPVKEIQIIGQDPRYIRAVLEHFLPEEEQKESLFGFEKKNEFDEYFSEEDFDAYLKEKEKLKRLEDRKSGEDK
ncbi:MAG: hypothetical protein KAQ64_01170 [Candidatus Pacebacteria bacterium]|nr:hypothetical protein [Candidatus Paceibacterota bacterium]